MRELTEAHLEALRRLASQSGGWCGPRPGSNFWPRLYLDTLAGEVEGEMIEAFARMGLVQARPCKEPRELEAVEEEDFPGADLDHDWDLTPAGRTALNPPAREGEGDHG